MPVLSRTYLQLIMISLSPHMSAVASQARRDFRITVVRCTPFLSGITMRAPIRNDDHRNAAFFSSLACNCNGRLPLAVFFICTMLYSG